MLTEKKWNGKAKEYYEHDFNEYSCLKFDGEYFDGIKKGKEYDKEGGLIFEGEYLDGKKWNGILYNKWNDITYPINNGIGIIKEYNEYNMLIFDGEYINGNKKGKEYDSECGQLIFEGEYLNDKKWIGNLKKYEKFKSNISIGHREIGNLTYNKEIKMKKENNDKNILKYEGEYLNGEKNGKGKEYDINGELIFEGKFINGKKSNKKILVMN